MVTERFGGLLEHRDRRLPHYELVLGVAAGGAARCYPLAALDAAARALNDRLGDTDIAVFYRPNTWMAGAYDRRLEGRALSFRTEGGAIVDAETGSRWEVSGVAVAGPLKGRQLKYVNSGVEEFHIWAAFHPGTSIHGIEPGSKGRAWTVDIVPKAVRKALDKGWWPRGARLLDVRWSDGVVAAWAAESGLKVLGVDPDPAAIARAKRSFGRLPDLEFEVADLRTAAPYRNQFDALYDYGLLCRLAPQERQPYLAHLAAAAKPGARFLLLLPVEAAQAKERVQAVRRLLAREFHYVDSVSAAQPHPETGAEIPGIVMRLVRGGWLAGQA